MPECLIRAVPNLSSAGKIDVHQSFGCLSPPQERNGYLRFEADAGSLRMEAVSSDDGSVMDRMELLARPSPGPGR